MTSTEIGLRCGHGTIEAGMRPEPQLLIGLAPPLFGGGSLRDSVSLASMLIEIARA